MVEFGKTMFRASPQLLPVLSFLRLLFGALCLMAVVHAQGGLDLAHSGLVRGIAASIQCQQTTRAEQKQEQNAAERSSINF